ncbi:MAG: phosphatase PAP2 family protein [bacterium]
METLKFIDLQIFRFFNSKLSNGFFDFLAFLPEYGLPFVIVFVILIFFFRKKNEARYKLAAVMLIAGHMLCYYTVELLRNFIGRARPCNALIDAITFIEKTDGSFPSGHTCEAFMAAVYLAGFFGKMRGALIAAAVLTGLSRIYMGVHYPSDVLAGAAIGIVIGRFLIRTEKKILPAGQKINPHH